MTTRSILDVDGAAFVKLLRAVEPLLAGFINRQQQFPTPRALEHQPVMQSWSAPPQTGRSIEELLSTLQHALDDSIDTSSCGTFIGIPATGLPAAAIADLIGAVLNRFTGVAVGAPALVRMEVSVLQWAARLLGLPESAAGVLLSGASTATLAAMVAARDNRLPEEFRRGTVYASTEVHSCVAKASHAIGLPAEALRRVAIDENGRLDIAALRAAIAADRKAGHLPFCVVGSAGTTNTGAIDPLSEIARVAREESLWYHIDAAYGGFFCMTQRGQTSLAGIEQADSVVLDPHKGLFAPFGSGLLLVRHGEWLQHSFRAEYMPNMSRNIASTPDGGPLPDFSTLGPELTRPARGLSLWLPLHLYGVAAFRDALDQKLDLAQQVYRSLKQLPQLTLAGDPDLTVVAFRWRSVSGDPVQEDAITTKLSRYLCDSRGVQVGTTTIRGRCFIRLAILNLRTNQAVIALLLDAIRAFIQLENTD
jgi:aromatic-L-amino-acid decarboxylase